MTPGGRRVTLVAAVARNGVVGDTRPGRPDIPWRLPGEQAQFKELTLGHVLVMGRATWDTVGRPLPGRTTVVLTRDAGWVPPAGVLVARTLDEALALADAQPAQTADGRPVEVMVVGGAQVYAAVLAHRDARGDGTADAQVLTEVPLEPEGDVHYPEVSAGEWVEVARERFEHWERVRLERR